jgi:general secretion pathway protein I
MSAPDREAGFTLIEMLVALAIFSLAALALLRLEGATVANTARLQDQALAQTVARNLAVEVLTDPVAPAFGREAGREVNGGRPWAWTRPVERSPEPAHPADPHRCRQRSRPAARHPDRLPEGRVRSLPQTRA